MKWQPPKKMTDLERFEHGYMPVTESGCWIWIGSASGSNGINYGQMVINGKQKSMHRWSYEYFKGHIPDGMFVCHKCDVSYCVNPDHLFLGTAKDNMQDASKKGRLPHGDKNTEAKLTNSQVIQIKQRLKTYTHGLGAELATEYGVSRTMISYIKNGKWWNHIDEDGR